MNPIIRPFRLSYQLFADPWINLKKKYLPFPELKQPIEDHLESAMSWLRETHRATNYRGSSAAFIYLGGWRPAYPETTGYIAKTFLDYHEFSSKKAYSDEAVMMCDWLIDVQKEDGGINQGSITERDKNPSVVFNTGMVMMGWIAAYKKTKDKKYLEATIRAGDFLVEIRENEQTWLKHCYRNIPHSYHSRVAWPMLELYLLTKEQRYQKTATDIYSWVLDQQKDNGHFNNCSFEGDAQTCNIHGIAYTLRGLLEGFIILKNRDYMDAVLKTSELLLKKFEIKKYLATSYNEKWKPIVKTECLTGIAQLSIIWFKIYELTRDLRFLNAGLNATDLLCFLQNTRSRFKDIRGAIKGSHPIWGKYASYQYPNWATKFFSDALMLRLSITNNLEEKLL